MDSKWYKNAVIYGINVKTFQDSNGDGVGDFQGLIQRLDYLADLGVNCLWLLPFYASPNRDNGYDVSDFYHIDPRCGTLEDFREFIREAHKRKIRVLIDFVIHHTSNKHPWFQAARMSEKSIYRKYYVWSKKRPKTPQPDPAFPGHENDVWHYDKVADAWYFHQFYYFQPDLNIANLEVQREILKITEFWASFGIDGVRIDAAGLLFTYKGVPYTVYKRPWYFLRKVSASLNTYTKDAVLLGEADTPIEELNSFFGEGDRFQLLLNFIMCQKIFSAAAAGDAGPIVETLRHLPPSSAVTDWVNFIRNLDELNLDKLTPQEQRRVYQEFAKRKGVKIYGRGIRRRTAPMFRNGRRLKMIFALLFGLPGNPLISYGDEIGMGDDLRLPERNAARTPMQWSSKRNGGFSEAAPGKCILPVISKGTYGYSKVNVEAAMKDPGSLYHVVKRLIALRKRYPLLDFTNLEVMQLKGRKVLGLKYVLKKETLIVLYNLTNQETDIEVQEMGDWKFREIFYDRSYPRSPSGGTALGPYGYRWFYAASPQPTRKPARPPRTKVRGPRKRSGTRS